MRIFSLFLFLFIEYNSFSQKKLDNIITNNSYGLRLEVKNFFVSTDRYKIQEMKPFYNINDKFKVGFGFCFLREKSFNTHDFDLNINACNFFISYSSQLSNIFSAEATIDFGMGRLKTISFLNEINKCPYSFFEPALILNYDGFNLFSLGLGSGFRITKKSDFIIKENLTLPTIILRFSLKFTEIYNHFLDRSNTSLYLNND